MSCRDNPVITYHTPSTLSKFHRKKVEDSKEWSPKISDHFSIDLVYEKMQSMPGCRINFFSINNPLTQICILFANGVFCRAIKQFFLSLFPVFSEQPLTWPLQMNVVAHLLKENEFEKGSNKKLRQQGSFPVRNYLDPNRFIDSIH